MSSRLVRGVLGSGASSIVLALVALSTTPYVLRGLGSASYGIFALLALTSAHLSNLELGFGHATVRFLARSHALGDAGLQDAVVETAFGISLFAASAGGLLMTGAAPLLARRIFRVPEVLQSDAVLCLRLGGAMFFFSALSSFFSAVLQGLSRYDWLNWTRIVLGTVSSLASVAVVYAGGGVAAVVAVQLLITASGAIVLAGAATAVRGHGIHLRVHWDAVREMGPYAVFMLGSGIAYQWMINGPSLVLATAVPTSELPAFSIPQSLFQRLGVLVSAVSFVFLPFASAASADADVTRLRLAFLSHLRLIVLGLAPAVAVLVVFSHRLLTIWVDSAFAQVGTPCLRWFAAASLFLAASGAAADIARGLGRPKWVLAFTAGVAGFATLGTAAAVGRYHAVGVAAAFAIALALGACAMVTGVATRLLALPAGELCRRLAGPVGAALSFALGVAACYRLWGWVLAAVCVVPMAFAYLSFVFRSVLLPRERSAITEAVMGRWAASGR